MKNLIKDYYYSLRKILFRKDVLFFLAKIRSILSSRAYLKRTDLINVIYRNKSLETLKTIVSLKKELITATPKVYLSLALAVLVTFNKIFKENNYQLFLLNNINYDSNIKLVGFPMITEVFLAISTLILITHISFVSYSKLYLSVLTQSSTATITVSVITLSIFLFWNDNLLLHKFIDTNENNVIDFLSFYSKLLTLILTLVILLIILEYLKEHISNNGEYFIILLLAEVGMLLLINGNDLLTIFLSIELQGLSFYVMAGYKKNSFYSVESGLKYFILGSLSTGLFLFGLSALYGTTGVMHLSKFNVYFFTLLPSSVSIFVNELHTILTQIICNLNLSFKSIEESQITSLKRLYDSLSFADNNISALRYNDFFTNYYSEKSFSTPKERYCPFKFFEDSYFASLTPFRK